MARMRSMRQRAWEKSAGICCLCGLPMHSDGEGPLVFTIEHILPKSRGGANEIENIDGSHQWCNQWKNGSTMEELPHGWRKFLRWKIKHLIANQR